MILFNLNIFMFGIVISIAVFLIGVLLMNLMENKMELGALIFPGIAIPLAVISFIAITIFAALQPHLTWR